MECGCYRAIKLLEPYYAEKENNRGKRRVTWYLELLALFIVSPLTVLQASKTVSGARKRFVGTSINCRSITVKCWPFSFCTYKSISYS